MQAAQCVRCRAPVRLRKVSASSRELQPAVCSATLHSSLVYKQKRKRHSTVTCCQKEDKSADKQAEASKENDSGKSKRYNASENSTTRPSYENGQPDGNRSIGQVIQNYGSNMANLRALKQEISAQQDWEEVGSSIVVLVGLPGCMAVSLGYILHLDPYGHLHWSSLDFSTGLTYAIPLVLCDLCLRLPDFPIHYSATTIPHASADLGLMLPKFSIQGIRQQAAPKPSVEPSSKASDPSPPKEESKQTSSSLLSFLTLRGVDKHTMPDLPSFTGTSHPEPGVLPRYSYDDNGAQPQWDVARETLRVWQMTYTLVNPGFDLLLPLEVVQIFLDNLTKQMLASAIVLAGLSGYMTDRILETKGLNLVPLLLNPSLSPADDGKWAALAVMVGYQALAAFLRASIAPTSNAQDIWNAKDSLEYDPATRRASEQDKTNMLATFLKKEIRRRKGEAAVIGARAMVETAFVGSSFLITGNLLAPLSAKAAHELLFSLARRAKYWQLQQTTLLRKI